MIFTIFPLFHSKSQTPTFFPFNHDMLFLSLSYLISSFLLFILSFRTYDKDDNKDFYLAKELPTVLDYPTDHDEDQ